MPARCLEMVLILSLKLSFMSSPPFLSFIFKLKCYSQDRKPIDFIMPYSYMYIIVLAEIHHLTALSTPPYLFCWSLPPVNVVYVSYIYSHVYSTYEKKHATFPSFLQLPSLVTCIASVCPSIHPYMHTYI